MVEPRTGHEMNPEVFVRAWEPSTDRGRPMCSNRSPAALQWSSGPDGGQVHWSSSPNKEKT